MLRCDKRGPGVIVSEVWPPIQIDEWQLTMDPRKVEEFTKKWEKDMKAAPRELDGSVGSPDQVTKTQQLGRLEKAAPHLPSPHEFPLDLATVALDHMQTLMGLEEKFQKRKSPSSTVNSATPLWMRVIRHPLRNKSK